MDSFTYLKNIEITTDQGIKSVAESFEPPVLENFEDHSILTITPYSLPEKLIEIGNAGYKTIIVKLAKQIKNTNGIEFADDYSWGYQVNEETPQKARIKFECNKEEGTLDSSLPVDVTKYNMSQRISLGFTEDPDYQFLRWDFDEKYVTIPDFKKVNATVLVIKETPEGETTSIKAVCAPRLRLDEENIITGTKLKDGSDAVYRNSSLQLAFSQGLPQDEAGKNQLDNINITVGGTSVAQCFMAPEFINEKTVQFVSDRNNRLDVPDGQTKTVTVSVPADLYYEYEYKEEKYKVTLGKEKSFSYIVSYETDDNAEVTFGVVSTSAGTITPSGQKSYAIGKKVAIKFEANEGWIFNGWKISSADEEMNSKIKIAAPSSEETELEIFDEIKGVIITADCTEMLNIESWSLTDTASDSVGSAEKPAVKDTGIKINFNKPLDAANKLNEIKIYADGNDCTSMYSKSLSEDKKTVTVTNTKRLSVEKNAVKTVTVSVPKSFYCTENGKKITMGQDASYNYSVNYKTTEKAKITFSIINGETGEAFETDAVPGTLEPLSYNEYYLDETIGISFAENAGYQFYRWDCDSSAITLTGKSSQSELKVNGAAVTSVKAVVYARPSVTGIKVNGTELGETVSADPFDKDSEIVINLAHEIEADAAKKITVTYTGDNFSQKDYFNTVYDRNSKTVTLKPVKILSLRSGYDNETVTVTVPADIYYIHKYKDTERTTILASGGEGISRSYKIRNATKNKTQVTYNYGSGSLSANGNTLSSGSNSSYSIDDSISLGFTASADSVFTGWKVSCAAGTSYTVSKTDYATSGTVTVKDGSGNLYFTLQIDSQNPSKATAKVNGYVSTGITVSAGERLVAKVNDSGFTPAYASAGVNCDTPVIIPFNKAMNASTVTLYNAQTNKGSIQIVNRESTGTHYEQYYEITAEGWSGNTLTISPKANVFEILGGAKTADIKVILNASAIKDADGKALEGVTEYSYRLNPTTNNKTKIKFVINGCTVKVDGVEINDGFFEEYSIGTKLEIECIPDESHKFISWSTGGISEDYVTVADDESSKTTLTLNKKGLSEITVTPQKILLPMMEASAVQPAYNAIGVYSDSKIVIPFNKEIDKTTVSLTSGSIQIVNKDNENTHYEQYYEIAENSWSGNTLTITPKVNVYEIFGTASIADIKVILGSGIKDKETDKNSLTGTTSFTYRINSTTSTKTKIQFIVGSTNCSVSLNGSEYSSNQTVEYNVGEKVEVQFIPNDGYKYSNCSMANNTSEAVSKTELGSGKYELKVTKSTTDVITLTPSAILLPKVNETGITPVLKTTGVECDTAIVIPFNKAIKNTTVSLYDKVTNTGSIQIVDAGNANTHYEEYFKSALTWSSDNKTLTITPEDDVYKILENSSTADIKVILGNGITDTETSSNALTETRFTYRINSKTSTKTKVKFAVAGKNCSIKIDGDESSADRTVDCYVGQKIEVQFIPNDGYKYSNCTMTNNTSETVSKTELGSGKYELKVTKATSDIITLTPSVILLPKVIETSVTPVLKTTGVECDTAIVIPFNKAIKNTTVSLYDKVTNTGSIQIVDAGNANTHYEEYFKSALTWSSDNKTLTITPEDDVYKILENSSTADIKVILENAITDNESSPNSLTGTTSFTYKINKNTTKKTRIKFVSDSHIKYIIKGEEKSGESTPEFNIGETFTVELIVDSGYTYNGPTTNATTKQYYTLEYKPLSKVYTVTTKKDNLFEETPNIPEFKMTSEIMPYVSTSTPEYSVEGVSMDTPIVIKFTRKMSSSQLNNANINIVDENGANVDEYFEDPIVSDDVKTVTIKPKGSKISELFENMSKRIFKVKLWKGIRGYNTAFSLNDYYGDEGYIKTICYNNTRSNAKPEVIAISFKNEENGTEFVETAIKTNEESIDNHAGSSVWIECKATDSGSGVKDLIIEEYLLNNKNGETSNFSAINNVNTTFTITDNLYSSNFRYDFKSPEDGLVKLVVKAVNYAGNQTEHPLTFYFTKDCIVDCENYYLTNSNGITYFASTSSYNYSTITNLNKKINTMSFHYLQDRWTSKTGSKYKQFPDIVLLTSNDKSSWTDVTPQTYTTENVSPYGRHYDFTISDEVKYIKAKITDKVGNTKETVYQLPETEVSKTSLISGGIRFVLDTADVDMDPIIAKQTNYLLRNVAKSTDTLDTSGTSTFYHNANATAGNNITLTTNYLTPDKYHTIYSVSCYEYYDASGNKQYIYGHPARYSSTVRLPSTYSYSEGSSSTYIPRFNTSLAVGPRNSNSYELSVTITNKANLADNGKYQFIVLINNTYDTTKNFESFYIPSVYYFDNGTSITIPMNYSLRDEYYVNVVALNQETGLYYQATPVCVRTDKDVVTPQLLNFTGLSGNGSYMFTSDYSEIKFYVTEDYGPNAGYLMDEDGNVFVDYWLVPYKKEWGTLNLDTIFTTEYIENLTFPTYHTSFNWNNFEWDFNDEECRTLNIPLQGIPYGKYVLVTKVYDKNGNFKCSADGILQTADIQCHYESLETEYNEGTGIDVNLGDDGDFIIRWGAFDKVNRKWIEDENYMDGHDYTVEMDSTGSHFTSARIDTNGLGEGIDFIRFTIAHHDSNSRNVQYIGPYYVLLGSDVSDYLKDIDYFDNTRASIYCSEPCIVETLMSTENYSSVEEWNRHAMRASPKQFDASGMYTIDTTKASAGEYYCVMAHFADGTNKMTEIRQK